ncbi:MAG: glutamine--fructose-6-phosphate transaminase (isomerizing) [Firmicutes bacterium]|nr:glutamine--fructose-6-phosphate transaminase (isomerizing) [Bacillota bacterium]
MCGIVGYIGDKRAQDILLSGLKRLEYRGYDSAGICILEDNDIKVIKSKGNLEVLIKKVDDQTFGSQGIGHTRWATHGKPSDENSHPHLSNSGQFCLVHNGIIENYNEIKTDLTEKGFDFKSETDSEVIVNLFEYLNDGDLLSTAKKVTEKLEGSYAIGVVNKENKDEFLVVRKDSPLVVGVGEGENFIASDIPAILEYTKKIYILDDDEMALISRGDVKIFDGNGKRIIKEIREINWSLESAEKQGYEHFMLKEINEQPEAIRKTLAGRIKNGLINLNLDMSEEYVKSINKIAVVACGTANYAGRVVGHLIEDKLRIPVLISYASEFRYNNPIIDQNTLTIVISQSGETADTLAGLREAKSRGSKIVAITNVVESSVAREADYVIYTQAGPEIAVASTKAYSTQIAALFMLLMELGYKRGSLDESTVKHWVTELIGIPEKMQIILENSELIKKYAEQIKDSTSLFFIGRGVDSVSCLEGALKLKEISYIHAEAYPAGELKHGTLALITDDVPVIAVATNKSLMDKIISNIEEVKTRGAVTYGVAFEDEIKLKDEVDYFMPIPRVDEALAPLLAVLPLQLLAYYTSVVKGNDVDKPRNLAKSVTVE